MPVRELGRKGMEEIVEADFVVEAPLLDRLRIEKLIGKIFEDPEMRIALDEQIRGWEADLREEGISYEYAAGTVFAYMSLAGFSVEEINAILELGEGDDSSGAVQDTADEDAGLSAALQRHFDYYVRMYNENPEDMTDEDKRQYDLAMTRWAEGLVEQGQGLEPANPEAHSQRVYELSQQDREYLVALAQRASEQQQLAVIAQCEQLGITAQSDGSQIASVEKDVVRTVRVMIIVETARRLKVPMTSIEQTDIAYDFDGDYFQLIDHVVDYVNLRSQESTLNQVE